MQRWTNPCGKEVAPRGQMHTDYVSGKVSSLLAHWPKMRGKLRLYSFINRDSINECLLFLNSGSFSHLSRCFRQNVTGSTESFFEQWASLYSPHAPAFASHPHCAHRPLPPPSTHTPQLKRPACLFGWEKGQQQAGRRMEGDIEFPMAEDGIDAQVTPLAWVVRWPRALAQVNSFKHLELTLPATLPGKLEWETPSKLKEPQRFPPDDKLPSRKSPWGRGCWVNVHTTVRIIEFGIRHNWGEK